MNASGEVRSEASPNRPSQWKCAQCGATGHAETAKGAARALDHHWMEQHRGEEE